jgi:hypothetical protein
MSGFQGPAGLPIPLPPIRALPQGRTEQAARTRSCRTPVRRACVSSARLEPATSGISGRPLCQVGVRGHGAATRCRPGSPSLRGRGRSRARRRGWGTWIRTRTSVSVSRFRAGRVASYTIPHRGHKPSRTLRRTDPVTVRADDVALGDLGKEARPRPPLERAADVGQLVRAVSVIEVHRTGREPLAAVGARNILQFSQPRGVLGRPDAVSIQIDLLVAVVPALLRLALLFSIATRPSPRTPRPAEEMCGIQIQRCGR